MISVLVTGGAGFIGSALVRMLIAETGIRVTNVDKLTYAGNLESLTPVLKDPRHRLVKQDICNRQAMTEIFAATQPDIVIHLAAETHVDRSIDNPAAFIQTNIVGTYELLEAARGYWSALNSERQSAFRFHHVSTDEVYGSLGSSGQFHEESAYAPSSPYSASKASADHLVRAWHRTYGLPVVLTNCSNNYGPYHFPEKLIPLMIINGLEGKPLPVYGTGANIRDWLYVEDHARALWTAATRGKPGETYNIGGNAERNNLDVVRQVCDLLDELAPAGESRQRLIQFVTDRPGHDLRYAMDTAKITRELAWRPRESFETGLRKTVAWYLANRDWWVSLRDSRYRGERLGLAGAAGAD